MRNSSPNEEREMDARMSQLIRLTQTRERRLRLERFVARLIFTLGVSLFVFGYVFVTRFCK